MQSKDERTKFCALGWEPDDAKGAVAVEENNILCNRIQRTPIRGRNH
jgi:hypothetical protein